MISTLIRAGAQAGAHVCNAIVEAIDARRPLHDNPLPAGHVGRMESDGPDATQDFTGYTLGSADWTTEQPLGEPR